MVEDRPDRPYYPPEAEEEENSMPHKWGWAFLPMEVKNTSRDNTSLIGIAHCYNPNCGSTITKIIYYSGHGMQQEERIIVPEFGCR